MPTSKTSTLRKPTVVDALQNGTARSHVPHATLPAVTRPAVTLPMPVSTTRVAPPLLPSPPLTRPVRQSRQRRASKGTASGSFTFAVPETPPNAPSARRSRISTRPVRAGLGTGQRRLPHAADSAMAAGWGQWRAFWRGWRTRKEV